MQWHLKCDGGSGMNDHCDGRRVVSGWIAVVASVLGVVCGHEAAEPREGK
jgi:hypothetical protein